MNPKSVFKQLFTLFISTLLFNVFCLGGAIASMDSGKLVYDEDERLTLPRNFRLMSSPFVKKLEAMPSREGLDNLPVSASAQFSEKTFLAIRKQLKGQIYVVDLRRESHGFVNKRPVSWYAPQNQSNLKVSTSEVEKIESKLFKKIKLQQPLSIYDILKKEGGQILKSKANTIVVNSAQTERQFIESQKLHYQRFAISDHQKPTDQDVDAFIEFYRNLPKNAWLHFHCRAGKGRTTTFLLMVDMLNNAKKVSLEDLVKRQYALGGAHILAVPEGPADAWKHDWSLYRKSFIELFYHYAKSDAYPNTSWSAWLAQHSQTL